MVVPREGAATISVPSYVHNRSQAALEHTATHQPGVDPHDVDILPCDDDMTQMELGVYTFAEVTPGADPGTTPLHSVDELADSYLTALRAACVAAAGRGPHDLWVTVANHDDAVQVPTQTMTVGVDVLDRRGRFPDVTA